MNSTLSGICGVQLKTVRKTFAALQAKSKKLPGNQKEYEKQLTKN